MKYQNLIIAFLFLFSPYCYAQYIVSGKVFYSKYPDVGLVEGKIVLAGDLLDTIPVINGNYKIENIEAGMSFWINEIFEVSQKDMNPFNGFNTLDYVHTLRYILGKNIFDNLYRYAAADMNGDKKISIQDLLIMRGLISSNFVYIAPKSLTKAFFDRSAKTPKEVLLLDGPKYFPDISASYQVDFVSYKRGEVVN